MGSWLVINTKPNSEKTAQAALSASYRNFDVYYPQMLRRISHAGRIRDVERPFLPRMIFVRDDGSQIRAICSAPGVSSVMRFGSEPAVLGDWVLDEIRKRETKALRPEKPSEFGVYVDLEIRFQPELARRFEIGEEVRVADGPFRGFNAIFEAQDDQRRAHVAIEIFGRANRVRLDLDQLEKL